MRPHTGRAFDSGFDVKLNLGHGEVSIVMFWQYRIWTWSALQGINFCAEP